MALKKSEIRLLIVLGVVVVAFLINQFVLAPKKKKPVSKTVTKHTAVPAVNSRSSQTETANEKVAVRHLNKQVFDTWGRDPFSSKLQQQKTFQQVQSGIVLKGIIWKKGKPYVLINNAILSAGEQKNGIYIVSIDGRKVTCKKNGYTFTLQWKG